jgi:hypothetical protein
MQAESPDKASPNTTHPTKDLILVTDPTMIAPDFAKTADRRNEAVRLKSVEIRTRP